MLVCEEKFEFFLLLFVLVEMGQQKWKLKLQSTEKKSEKQTNERKCHKA